MTGREPNHSLFKPGDGLSAGLLERARVSDVATSLTTRAAHLSLPPPSSPLNRFLQGFARWARLGQAVVVLPTLLNSRVGRCFARTLNNVNFADLPDEEITVQQGLWIVQVRGRGSRTRGERGESLNWSKGERFRAKF